HKRTSTNVSVRADLGELLNSARTPKDCVIVNEHVAGKLYDVSENAIIAHQAIMADVNVRHKQTVGTNDSFELVNGAPVDCHTFADGCIITNFGCSFFTAEFQILRNTGYDGAGKNLAILSDT